MSQQINPGYKISIKLDNMPDTVCYLANYFGDKTYLTDTAVVDDSFQFVFKGDSTLPGGIYIVAGQSNNKYFELIVDKDQHFTVVGEVSKMPENLKFENTPDNELFYEYVSNNIEKRKEIERLKNQKGATGEGGKEGEAINLQIKDLYDQLASFENELINKHPELFVSVLLKANQEPEIQPARHLENGHEDSVFAYQSYKNHYWDNLNPSDNRLLRTPLYHKRIKNYFEKVVYQQPDTLAAEADKFIIRANGNRETFKYAVWYLTYKFETTKIMGFDEIFVHMVDNYYAKGLAYWADTTIVVNLMQRADELRTVLIGSDAPNMILLDTIGSFKSLYGVDAGYTLILFYEIGCSHCRSEISALKSWYPENAYDLEIFAVSTDTNLVDWKKYIRKNELDWIHVNGTRSVTPDYHKLYDISVTPTIYLLDKHKKIIAKRLKADQLFPFIEDYDRRQNGLK